MFNFFVAGIKCFRLDLIHFRLELIFLWLELFPNFRFKVGHFFRREFFAFFDFRKGPLRPLEGQKWPNTDPKKITQNGLELNF